MRIAVTAAIHGHFSLDTAEKIAAELRDDLYIYRRKKVPIQVGDSEVEVIIDLFCRSTLVLNILVCRFLKSRKTIHIATTLSNVPSRPHFFILASLLPISTAEGSRHHCLIRR